MYTDGNKKNKGRKMNKTEIKHDKNSETRYPKRLKTRKKKKITLVEFEI